MSNLKLLKIFVVMGIFTFLFGGKSSATTPEAEVLPLEAIQMKEISSQAETAKVFLKRYADTGSSYSAHEIDKAIIAWRKSAAKDKEPPEQLIEQLGAYFGSYLATRLELNWMVYRDKQGADLCVAHKKVFVFSFPHSAIYKAVVQKRENALAEVETTLANQIKEALGNPAVRTH
jgi:Domain of unknown function (DUF3806)